MFGAVVTRSAGRPHNTAAAEIDNAWKDTQPCDIGYVGLFHFPYPNAFSNELRVVTKGCGRVLGAPVAAP